MWFHRIRAELAVWYSGVIRYPGHLYYYSMNPNANFGRFGMESVILQLPLVHPYNVLTATWVTSFSSLACPFLITRHKSAKCQSVGVGATGWVVPPPQHALPPTSTAALQVLLAIHNELVYVNGLANQHYMGQSGKRQNAAALGVPRRSLFPVLIEPNHA